MSRGFFLKLVCAISWLGFGQQCLGISGYVLGGGDVVRITVYDRPELAIVTRLSQEGTINFPLIGQVQLKGLTERLAENKIATLLTKDRLINSPQVTLFVEQYLSHQVSVLGQVENPGKYPLNSGNAVVDVISLAGGVTQLASDKVIIIKTSASGIVKSEIDLVGMLQAGQLDQVPELEGDEVVFVPKMDVFYIYGEARNPGSYRLERNMTVMQALSVAGSSTERGSLRSIKISRSGDSGDMKTINAELTDAVKPNDVIYIKESLF